MKARSLRRLPDRGRYTHTHRHIRRYSYGSVMFEFLVPRDQTAKGHRLLFSALAIFTALLALNFHWWVLSSIPTSEG